MVDRGHLLLVHSAPVQPIDLRLRYDDDDAALFDDYADYQPEVLMGIGSQFSNEVGRSA